MVLKIREYAGRRLIDVDCRLVDGEFTGQARRNLTPAP